ncbi:four helix bundle protein [Cytophagales bacterium LB-30]|uniref:Four helix bundle protein n=1 Tax=Shiella aurantiaca TaxID=3058365 RepID=A0ABT8F5M7_9BACT|nr:four helix bundle protein [Shiella aurantiaca]MDN4165603.1 four helix bundle protein [Shiella aurantiaca]
MEYTELEVWKITRQLVSTVYLSTKAFPKEEQFGLSNQIKRAAVSVPSNIAEGCGRRHVNDSLQFFYIARGSLYELETQLYLAFDLGFISKNKQDELLDQITQSKKLIQGFINYVKNINTKG